MLLILPDLIEEEDNPHHMWSGFKTELIEKKR
jgi:hypothetical protein